VPSAPTTDWIWEWLQVHLSQEELEKVEPFLRAESWASPSARRRGWQREPEEIPLRFRLEIDLKV
jgi:hypothetical protein